MINILLIVIVIIIIFGLYWIYKNIQNSNEMYKKKQNISLKKNIFDSESLKSFESEIMENNTLNFESDEEKIKCESENSLHSSFFNSEIENNDDNDNNNEKIPDTMDTMSMTESDKSSNISEDW